MTADLTAYLRAALDAAEATARAAIRRGGDNLSDGGTGDWAEHYEPGFATIENDEMCIYDEGGHTPNQAAHIAFWDPATVLRHVHASRRLVEFAAAVDADGYSVLQLTASGVLHDVIKIEAERWGWTEET